MRILAIREKTVPLASSLRNANIGFGAMTASALVVATDAVREGKPVNGLAFDSIGRYGHGGLLRERFIPRLLAAKPEDYADARGDNIDPAKLWAIAMQDEKPGGHGERPGAVGLIDAAAWDIVAKLEGKPLWRVLAERFGEDGMAPDGSVAVYASGGHYRPSGDLDGLKDEIRRYVDLGHMRIKIKIGGAPLAADLKRVEAALAILGTGSALALDCNGTFDRARAFEYLDALAPYGLAWLEEPVDPLDFELHRELAATTPMPLATGENIFSVADARNLLRHGGLRPARDWLQMDISLSYGIVEYLRMLEVMAAHGWSRRRALPHAGHLLALHAAAGLGLGGHESAPDPTHLIGGFPDGVSVEHGTVRAPEDPGVGIERKANLYAVFRDLLD